MSNESGPPAGPEHSVPLPSEPGAYTPAPAVPGQRSWIRLAFPLGCLALVFLSVGAVYLLWPRWPRTFYWETEIPPNAVVATYEPPPEKVSVLISRLIEYKFTGQGSGYSYGYEPDANQRLLFFSPQDHRTSEVVLKLPELVVPGFELQSSKSTTVTLSEGDGYVVTFSGIPAEQIFFWIDGRAVRHDELVESRRYRELPGRTRLLIKDDRTTPSQPRALK